MLKLLFFSRIMPLQSMARWQSGYAEDCKSLDAGSIPTQASRIKSAWAAFSCFPNVFYTCKNGRKFLI